MTIRATVREERRKGSLTHRRVRFVSAAQADGFHRSGSTRKQVRIMAPEEALHLHQDPVTIPESNLAPPVVTYLTAERKWRLEQPYSYWDKPFRITIPRGFTFDLASIPRPLWWIIAPFELSIAAPLVHDFLYRYQGNPGPGAVVPPRTYTRKEADRVFKRIMKQEGVWSWRWRSAYAAVRLFGEAVWEGRSATFGPDLAIAEETHS